MSGLVVRAWTPEDSEELARLFIRSVREVARRDYRPAQIEAWAEAAGEPSIWAERMRDRVVFVADENGHAVGFIQFDPPDHIDMTYVHPERQRMGVATALLAALEAEARRRGVKILHAEASITSHPFFEARGYETLTPQFVRVRCQDFLNYRMRKRLP